MQQEESESDKDEDYPDDNNSSEMEVDKEDDQDNQHPFAVMISYALEQALHGNDYMTQFLILHSEVMKTFIPHVLRNERFSCESAGFDFYLS